MSETRKFGMRWTFIMGLAVVTALAGRSSAAGQTPRPEGATSIAGKSPTEVAPYTDRVLWLDADHQFALFLPERVTATATVDDLPLKPYQRRALERIVGIFQNPESGYSCMKKSTPEPGAGDAMSIDQLISSAEVSFTGTVVRTVPGWSPWTSEVVTTAYIQVDELIHGGEVPGSPRSGDIIAIYYYGGTTVVENTQLCADPIKNFPIPLKGDRILLAGKPWQEDPSFFYDTARFPLVDDEIRPEPRADLVKDSLPRPLKEVVQEVRAETRERRH